MESSNPALLGGVERRRHKRYTLNNNALAFLGKDTATILDISKGGMSVHYAVIDKETPLPQVLDIFLAHSRFYLQGIPVTLVDEVQILANPVFSTCKVKRLSMQFGPMTNEQQSRLDDFIALNEAVEN